MKKIIIVFAFLLLSNCSPLEGSSSISIPTPDLFLSERVPLFLAVVAQNYRETKGRVLDFILEELQFFPDANSVFSENLQDFFSENFKFPPTFHITTFYLGKNKSKMASPYYTNFVENQKFVIALDAIVLVPGKLIAGVTFPDRNKIMIENKFPHVTLMTADWSPVDSNYVMQALFDDGKPLHDYYSTDFFESSQPFFEKYNLEVNASKGTETVDIYVIKSAPALLLDSLTKKEYSA